MRHAIVFSTLLLLSYIPLITSAQTSKNLKELQPFLDKTSGMHYQTTGCFFDKQWHNGKYYISSQFISVDSIALVSAFEKQVEVKAIFKPINWLDYTGYSLTAAENKAVTKIAFNFDDLSHFSAYAKHYTKGELKDEFSTRIIELYILTKDKKEIIKMFGEPID